MTHIQPLPPGPLALIGDIHGELEALDALLGHLDRHHPAHHLVFLGDLADRGPDSPGVIRRVAERLETGAQCILGNHELSVLRGQSKGYNTWYFTHDAPWKPRETGNAPVPMVPATPVEQREAVELFSRLPLALERDDLRVVHACWHPPSIARARASDQTILELFGAIDPVDDLDKPAALFEWNGGAMGARDPAWEAHEAAKQNGSPVAVLTAGTERPADPARGDAIVWSGNQWRPLVRERWWEDYDDPTPVVIGHYSRKWDPAHRDAKTRLMFGEAPSGAPLGPRRNVYCIDYAVGTRFEERHEGRRDGFIGRLAALLWDEGPRRLLFDDGASAVC